MLHFIARPSFVLLIALLGTWPQLAVSGETLPNGIVLPDVWPPATKSWTGEPMPVPYLKSPPDVIPIDVGRQLFVDDFLIAETDLKRTYHAPRYHESSPVLKPEKPWEVGGDEGDSAAPFSDGVWYDPARKQFAMWYRAADRRTCLALSDDGLTWSRPELDVEPGTNVVLTSQNKTSQRDSNTVWLDLDAADPAERFKLFEARYAKSPYCMALRTSADGVHWSDEQAVSARSWDRSTAFYNPFRNVWVASVRGHDNVKPAPPHRLRNYFEGPTAADALGWKQPTDDVSRGEQVPHDLQPWVGADRLDPHHPDPRFAKEKPQLYNLDVFPYESLLVGLFTIWQGPTNEVCKELDIQKRNEVFVGFTRDGFHWDRANRERFLPVSDDPQAWNAANVQSVGGGCLVVGDELRFYCSGRKLKYRNTISTGLAVLRRDGFASLDADDDGGTLTTRPLTFTGTHLFVNAAADGGDLRVELLDAAGRVLPGFDRDNCAPLDRDDTKQCVGWAGVNLADVRTRPVRLRFHLRKGSLYSFWISDHPSGTSNGYLAAGSPGRTEARDILPAE
jgi:hypothetical protein